MSRQATPAPQPPHPRGHATAPRGIKFPIRDGGLSLYIGVVGYERRGANPTKVFGPVVVEGTSTRRC